MAYCTVTDVQTLIKSLTFSASTKVTESEITAYHIPAADAIIDGRLRKHYTVPITNTTDLVLLKRISAQLAAGIVAAILYETATQPNEVNPAKRNYDYALRLLDMIEKNEITLVTARGEVAWARLEEIYEEQDQSDDLAPMVTIEKEF
jgi:phage gp36-like protein